MSISASFPTLFCSGVSHWSTHPPLPNFSLYFFLAIYTSVTLFISSGPPFFASDTIRRNPPFLLSNLQVPFTLSSFKNHHLFHVNPSTHPCILFLSLPSFLGTLFFFYFTPLWFNPISLPSCSLTSFISFCTILLYDPFPFNPFSQCTFFPLLIPPVHCGSDPDMISPIVY